MNDINKTQFDDALEHGVVDFLTNAPDEELSAFLQEEALEIQTLAGKGRDALARARLAATSIPVGSQTDGRVNPFSDIGKLEYRALAESLGINTLFLNRIRDREVLIGEFPIAFLNRLATGLWVTATALRQYLSQPPVAPLGGMFRSDSKPVIAGEASPFVTVARESGLTEEQIKHLFE
jgi:hypothetical protein